VGAQLAHFAINADDVAAARAFYEAVFGWSFRPWGPPGFFQIEAGAGAVPVQGALQSRRALLPETKTVGFECTFGVDDVDVVAKTVVAHGGRLLMDKTTIAGVGELVWFEDPAGNVVGAMRYDPGAE
jgi:predicted enzyme related to lactoylglutathione lyase